ncbi:MAG: tetratricopeptide repeat protein, partial [Cyclobacteriaceae bacterium]
MSCLARKALVKSKTENYELGLSNAYSALGEFHRRTSSLDSSLYFHRHALMTREKLGRVDLAMNSLANIGLVSLEMGEFDFAKSNYRKEIEYFESVKPS